MVSPNQVQNERKIKSPLGAAAPIPDAISNKAQAKSNHEEDYSDDFDDGTQVRAQAEESTNMHSPRLSRPEQGSPIASSPGHFSYRTRPKTPLPPNPFARPKAASPTKAVTPKRNPAGSSLSSTLSGSTPKPFKLRLNSQTLSKVGQTGSPNNTATHSKNKSLLEESFEGLSFDEWIES